MSPPWESCWEPQVFLPQTWWWLSGLADFSPSLRFGKGVFRKNVGSFVGGLDDWNLPVHKLKINLWGWTLVAPTHFFQHQSLCSGIFFLLPPGRKHMVSHSGTPRFLFGGWSMLRIQGINPSSILRIQLEYSKWRKNTTTLKIYISAVPQFFPPSSVSSNIFYPGNSWALVTCLGTNEPMPTEPMVGTTMRFDLMIMGFKLQLMSVAPRDPEDMEDTANGGKWTTNAEVPDVPIAREIGKCELFCFGKGCFVCVDVFFFFFCGAF